MLHHKARQPAYTHTSGRSDAMSTCRLFVPSIAAREVRADADPDSGLFVSEPPDGARVGQTVAGAGSSQFSRSAAGSMTGWVRGLAPGSSGLARA